MKAHAHAGPVVAILAGLLLSALSVPALVYGLHATRAFATYHQAKWRSSGMPPGSLLELCDDAHAQYPHNYRLSTLAAETALAQGLAAGGEEADAFLEMAEDWCDTGLEQNASHPELREMKARLLAYGSHREAVAYWERYLDWHFWEPWNHAVMVDLSVEAGDLARAEAALKWLEGSAHHAAALRQIEEARKQQSNRATEQPLNSK